MSDSKKYELELEQKIQNLKKQISDIKNNSELYAKAEMREKVDDLETRVSDLQEKSRDLKTKSGDAWDELKKGINKAADDISRSIKGALDKFK